MEPTQAEGANHRGPKASIAQLRATAVRPGRQTTKSEDAQN